MYHAPDLLHLRWIIQAQGVGVDHCGSSSNRPNLEIKSQHVQFSFMVEYFVCSTGSGLCKRISIKYLILFLIMPSFGGHCLMLVPPTKTSWKTWKCFNLKHVCIVVSLLAPPKKKDLRSLILFVIEQVPWNDSSS